MAVIRATFESFGGLYIRWFSDWLHIHFLIRTVLLLLMAWLVIYVAAQLFQYVLAPVVLMLFECVLKRSVPKYAQQVRRSRRIALQLMVICAVISTLWITAFGLHHEYAVPVVVLVEEQAEPTEILYAAYEDVTDYVEISMFSASEIFETYDDDIFNPAAWLTDADIVFYLNEEGAMETRLRSGPGVAEYSVIEILWDNDLLVYLHHFYPDAEEVGLFWLRVLSPSGTVGYVSSHLVGKVEGL